MAHVKPMHGSTGPIVRSGKRNGIARPAVCTVVEGVVKAAIAWIVDFGEAGRAGGDIGGNKSEARIARGAFQNRKAAVGGNLSKLFHNTMFYPGGGRSFRFQR